MRIRLVGPEPHQACGVGDYTRSLLQALQEAGIEVGQYSQANWRLRDLPATMRRLKAGEPEVIHLQYPAAGYRTSLAPQLLLALTRDPATVVTLHEFAQARALRCAASCLFAASKAWLVFTNTPDRASAIRSLPGLARRSTVIPIGCSIPPLPYACARDPLEVAYFGLIRPQKGLEQFLALAEAAARAGRPYRFVIIGAIAARWRDYASALRSRNSASTIRWVIDAPPAEAATALAHAQYAYLPFPDGASDRRSSLLAALTHRLATITTSGRTTPPGLASAVRIAPTPREALAALDRLTAAPEERDAMARAAEAYLQPRQWGLIAAAHIHLYAALLGRRSALGPRPTPGQS